MIQTSVLRLICLLAFFALPTFSGAAEPPVWIDNNAAGERQVHLYFFWTRTCPHCQVARPFIEALPERHAWLVLHSREITSDQAAAESYVAMAETLGQKASSVPGFLFCGRMEVGFDRPQTSGKALEDALQSCHESGSTQAVDTSSAAQVPAIDLPLIGQMTYGQRSLPVLTLSLIHI